MKSKRIITIITVLASLVILSVTMIRIVKDNNTEDIARLESDYIQEVESTNDSNDNSTDNSSIDSTDDGTDELEIAKVNVFDERNPDPEDKPDVSVSDTIEEREPMIEDIYDTITISAAGDVTLGRDESFGWERTFDHELDLQGGDFGYFFRNVKDIFEADDLTIVNLETTLTTATKKADKKYRFKADPSYVEILKQGSIEAVSIANNHTLDFLEKGYQDTLMTLDEAEVGYFGYEHIYITEIRDVKIGVLGYYSMKVTDKLKKEIKQAIDKLKSDGTDLVIVMFHWGIERDYWPNSVQKKLAYFSIDSGADLVLGSHPHVLQGIEEYNGKQIIYSLANFCFGGNKNPSDKDTMIYIQRFNFKNGELISQEYDIIPCSISSVESRNNYHPTPLEGDEAERTMYKINKYSDF